MQRRQSQWWGLFSADAVQWHRTAIDQFTPPLQMVKEKGFTVAYPDVFEKRVLALCARVLQPLVQDLRDLIFINYNMWGNWRTQAGQPCALRPLLTRTCCSRACHALPLYTPQAAVHS